MMETNIHSFTSKPGQRLKSKMATDRYVVRMSVHNLYEVPLIITRLPTVTFRRQCCAPNRYQLKSSWLVSDSIFYTTYFCRLLFELTNEKA